MKIIISELPLSPWWWQGVPAYDDNPAMQAGTIPNQSLVVSERNMLITILKGLDVDIFESPFPKKLDDKYLQHDFIYIRDQFISDQNGNAVILQFRNPKRKVEQHDWICLNALIYTFKAEFLRKPRNGLLGSKQPLPPEVLMPRPHLQNSSISKYPILI